jgi:hypothetical protein
MQLEPEHVLAISMLSLLALGALAQFMQTRGGSVARAAPVVILSLLLMVSAGGMLAIGGTLSDLRQATDDT